jgi:hypothetical protein
MNVTLWELHLHSTSIIRALKGRSVRQEETCSMHDRIKIQCKTFKKADHLVHLFVNGMVIKGKVYPQTSQEGSEGE